MEVALVYRSKSRILPGSEQFREVLEDIRYCADQNNRKVDITGFLLYSNGFFYQVMEGEFHDVSALFSRILRDERHFDVELISNSPIRAREFYDWSMGWSIDLIKSRHADLSMKITLLQDYVNKFGMSKPILRDIISRIAQDMADFKAREPANAPAPDMSVSGRQGRGRLAAAGGRLFS